MSANKLLAFSSSRTGTGGFLEEAIEPIHTFLGNGDTTIAFIPFASVTRDDIAYGEMVSTALATLPYTVQLVQPENAAEVISNAGAIMTGGGNTFKLLHDIYKYNLLDLIRNRINAGVPYIGWSAGANITGATIGTTNDMPIAEPKSFNALGILPFQLNPHYFNIKIEGHNGETRDQRLEEYLAYNAGVPVVGLPEGTRLHLENGSLFYKGGTGILLTMNEGEPMQRKEIADGEDLSFLL